MIERLLAAESALARDEVDAAERQFRVVADADPRNAIAVVGLARIAARRGDREAARALAGRALEIDPDEAAAHRLVAELDRASPDVPAAVPPPAAAATPSEAAAATPEPMPVPAPAAPPAPAPAAPRGRSWWRRILARLLGRG